MRRTILAVLLPAAAPVAGPAVTAAGLALALPVAAAILAAPVAAQSFRSAPDTVVEVFDSSDATGWARSRQSAFERRRARLVPRTLQSWSSRCDEIVGRFCEWYDEGEWTPDPEPPEIDRLRRALVAQLDSVAAHLPGDDWLLGQRVWYRAEGGAWAGAARTARACGATPWWCAALEGLALHGLGDYVGAERAFETALAGMPPDTARRWRVPERAVRGGIRGLLDDDLPADSLNGLLDRLWVLADPLYLVPGNDRRTAHYARWTFSHLRDDARNPFGIRWGGDLEELTVRHGWELWWEQSVPRHMAGTGPHVIGHKHPQGREFMPEEDAFRAPWAAPAEALVAGKRNPRSLYAPDYAPVLLPMDGQFAVFPRGDRVRVVATTFLPPDTTIHAGHAHPVPWLEAGDQADMPDRRALVLVSPDGRARHAGEDSGTDGVLVLEAPAGRWIASAEVWSPALRRAGRHRRGVVAEARPPDLPVLSDLLFVATGGPEPATLEEAAAGALTTPAIRAGQGVGVVWEVTGLGFAPADLTYRLSVTRDEGGFFRRAGRWLGLVGEPHTLRLAWGEAGPEDPSVVLRRVDVASETLDPGAYEVRLEIGLPGRRSLVSTARLRVEAPG